MSSNVKKFDDIASSEELQADPLCRWMLERIDLAERGRTLMELELRIIPAMKGITDSKRLGLLVAVEQRRYALNFPVK
jgi:hypothetical protein